MSRDFSIRTDKNDRSLTAFVLILFPYCSYWVNPNPNPRLRLVVVRELLVDLIPWGEWIAFGGYGFSCPLPNQSFSALVTFDFMKDPNFFAADLIPKPYIEFGSITLSREGLT